MYRKLPILGGRLHHNLYYYHYSVTGQDCQHTGGTPALHGWREDSEARQQNRHEANKIFEGDHEAYQIGINVAFDVDDVNTCLILCNWNKRNK